MSHEILDFENFQKSKLSEIYVLFDNIYMHNKCW